MIIVDIENYAVEEKGIQKKEKDTMIHCCKDLKKWFYLSKKEKLLYKSYANERQSLKLKGKYQAITRQIAR